ncbi:hypothetical protein N6H14_28165 [Paenibacillus sp. CC-CFT747]|nr:hypothetical protein N6H14_28165 [Paenibacillus sp. CC-CFT747]
MEDLCVSGRYFTGQELMETDREDADALSSEPLEGDAVLAMGKQEGAAQWLQEKAAQRGMTLSLASEMLLRSLAKEAGALLSASPQVTRLVLNGGETARAVMKELGISVFSLHREWEPGIIEASCDDPRPFKLVTKSGAFGDEEALVRIWKAHRRGVGK